MPHVASDTQSHALKPTQARANRPAPAPDRPSGAFESMLDNNAAAAAERAAQRPDDSTVSRAAPRKASPADKATASKPAKDIDDSRPVEDRPGEKGVKATDKSESADKAKPSEGDETDQIAVAPDAAAQASNESQPVAAGPVAILAPVDATVPLSVAPTETSADPVTAVTVPTAVAESAVAGTAAVVETDGYAVPVNPAQVKPQDQQDDAEGKGEDALIKKSDGALAMKTDNAPVSKVDGASTKNPEDAFASKSDDAPARKPDEAPAKKAGEALADEADGPKAESKPLPPASPDADKEQVGQARGDVPAHAHRGHADAGPAATADANASAAKPAGDAAPPQILPASPHALTNPTAAAATAAAPAQPLQQQPAVPLNGVAVEIASKAVGGKNRFEIRLDPPELGRIDVRLDVDRNGHVTSRLIVDRQDTLDLLRRDASGLERALQDAGLKTSDNGLQFSLRDQMASQQDHQGDGEQARLVIDDEAMPVADLTAQSYRRLSGRAGGLDIRV